MKSINPFNNEVLAEYKTYTDTEVQHILSQSELAFSKWKNTSFEERAKLMKTVGNLLRTKKRELAALITSEMGKLISESIVEIEKCASCCDYYAENAEKFLSREYIKTDAPESYIEYNPLGIVLAVMPWNFPLWQVFRFAAPTLMAGNTGILKHASNVPQCAMAIEQLFKEAGFPEYVFSTLLISSNKVEGIIADKRVKAVTLTGSEFAGSQVASTAGKYLKKSVLELGGSDPFIVLADADLDMAAETAIKSRLINAGQSCIAAKRFFIEESIYDTFTSKIEKIAGNLTSGNPAETGTQLAPMANSEFALQLKKQVEKSVASGAILHGTIEVKGAYFRPVFLHNVSPGMPAFDEELFGPVFSFIKIKNIDEAIKLANQSDFGLGATIFTRDTEKAKLMASRIESGSVFVNGLMKSDIRLPFGGIKNSGYGRELSYLGIREFVNTKTVCFK